MALIEKSLTFLTLGAMAIALAGCPGTTTETGDDSGKVEDTNPEETGETGTKPPDTGTAALAFTMEGATSGPTWAGGSFGIMWYGIYTGVSVCDVIGDMVDAGSPPAPGCPDCAWSFNLKTQGSVASGTECEDLATFGAPATYDGAMDDDGYSWGWADEFDFYGDGSAITTSTILIYSTKYSDWGAFAWNYGSYPSVYGDATSFQAFSFRSYYYYYYL